MKTSRILLPWIARAASLAAVAAAPSWANGGNVYVYGNIAGWEIRTDAAHAYRCFATVEYEGGTSLRIGYDNDSATLYLDVADPAWSHLQPGEEKSTILTFDDADPVGMTGVALAGERSGLRFAISAGSEKPFLADFKSRQQIAIVVDGAGIDLSLAGSHRALEMLADCQMSMARHALKPE